MSNAQMWYVLIASTILIFAAIMEFGGGGK